MKIAIITDGNSELGMGHVYQSLTLAELLTKSISKNSEIVFLTKSNKNVCEQIFKKGYKVTSFKNDKLIFDALKNFIPDRIIFDKLDVSPELAKKISEDLSCKLCIFTNVTDANQYADITVFPRIGSNYKNIDLKINTKPQTEFVGPRYWILRPEFYELKKRNKVLNSDVKDITLMFGGADFSNFSSSVLDTILKIDSSINIFLILGSAFEHDEEINRVIEKNKNASSKIIILKNINNVGEIIFKSDLLITSPGLSFFEALVVGTPVIAFYQNTQQKKEFESVIHTMGFDEIYKLPSIITNRTFIFPNDPDIKAMEIGEGKNEILDEILSNK